MSNRILLASSIAILSLAVNAAPATYTQIVPSANGPVTVEVQVENGDFRMVRVLPSIAASRLNRDMNATNHAELDSLTANAIDMSALRVILTQAIEKAAAEAPDPGFVPGTYRSTLVAPDGDIALEFVIGEHGVGDMKILKKP